MEAMRTVMRDLMNNVPGIDESMAYIEFMRFLIFFVIWKYLRFNLILIFNYTYNLFFKKCRLVRGLNYSIVVFDTAPTGHTLRLLQFPMTIQKTVSQMLSMTLLSFKCFKRLKHKTGHLLVYLIYHPFRVLF